MLFKLTLLVIILGIILNFYDELFGKDETKEDKISSNHKIKDFSNEHFINSIKEIDQCIFSSSLSEESIGRDRPCVARKLTNWPAISLWDDNYLINKLPSKIKVHVSDKPWIRMHSSVQPFGQLQNVKWLRPWKEEEIEPKYFFSSLRHLYFFSHLNDLPTELKDSINDIHHFTIPWRSLWEINLWMTKPLLTTPVHYDLLHNFYCQIRGTKKFLLFPPTDSSNLYIFPRLHPASRMTQVTLDNLKFFNNFNLCNPIEVVLNPGDVLYIPPYWFHHVSTNSNEISISISFHTESDEVSIRDAIISTAPVVTSDHEIAVAFFIKSLFNYIKSNLSQFLSTMIASRFSHLHLDNEVIGLSDKLDISKDKYNFENIDFKSDTLNITYKNYLRQESEKVAKLFLQFKEGIRSIELENYLEDFILLNLKDSTIVPVFLNKLLESEL